MSLTWMMTLSPAPTSTLTTTPIVRIMSIMWATQRKMEDSSGEKIWQVLPAILWDPQWLIRGDTKLTGNCQLQGKLSQGGKFSDKDFIGFLWSKMLAVAPWSYFVSILIIVHLSNAMSQNGKGYLPIIKFYVGFSCNLRKVNSNAFVIILLWNLYWCVCIYCVAKLKKKLKIPLLLFKSIITYLNFWKC